MAAGRPLGEDETARAGPSAGGPRLSPLAALEQALLPALRRPPCLVSFSGGRDSSLVLAAAARAARREGLAQPIPATLRFRDAPETDESRWQETVVRHLGLEDWRRWIFADELDLVGPVAARVLRMHGVLWPPQAFFNVPLLEAASGGSLVTGSGGDEIFVSWRYRPAADVLARRRRPAARDAARLAYMAAPPPLRLAYEQGRHRALAPDWLQPGPRREVQRLLAEERAGEPRDWRRWLGWRLGRRYRRAARWSSELLASGSGTAVVHPFLSPAFLAALARAAGPLGPGDRTRAMKAFFRGALPDGVLERRSKANFVQALHRSHTRDFLAGWDGSGIDESLVNVAGLAAHWGGERPRAQGAMLLQSAWLASARERDEPLLGRL